MPLFINNNYKSALPSTS